MSYAAGEAAAKVIVQGATGLSAGQVVSVANNNPTGYHHLLDRGTYSICIFLLPGSFATERTSLRDVRYLWNTIIEIWIPYRQPGVSEKARIDTTQAIVDIFPKCSTLGGLAGVFDARITAGDTPVDLRDTSERVVFLQQTLTLSWKEDI